MRDRGGNRMLAEIIKRDANCTKMPDGYRDPMVFFTEKRGYREVGEPNEVCWRDAGDAEESRKYFRLAVKEF